MHPFFTGRSGVPQITSIFQTQEANFLWGPEALRGAVIPVSGVLDGAARDSTNTPTTLLRPGLVLARKNGKFIQYSATGTGGQQVAVGVLGMAVSMIDYAANNLDQQVPIITRGPFLASALIGLDYQARNQLTRSGSLFDDYTPNDSLPWTHQTEVTDTAYTLAATESGGMFIATNASKTTFTLPTLAPGLSFHFTNIGAAGMRVAAAAAGTMIVGNDIAANNVEFVTSGEMIGSALHVFANSAGTKWHVLNISCPATTKTGSTVTVNT